LRISPGAIASRYENAKRRILSGEVGSGEWGNNCRYFELLIDRGASSCYTIFEVRQRQPTALNLASRPEGAARWIAGRLSKISFVKIEIKLDPFCHYDIIFTE